jgi:hypothetical protein
MLHEKRIERATRGLSTSSTGTRPPAPALPDVLTKSRRFTLVSECQTE